MALYAPFEPDYAGGGGATSTSMPAELSEFLRELHVWASANAKDARRDTVLFWSLKLPTIVLSSGSAVAAALGVTTAPIIGGAIASVLVVIDGVYCPGGSRNTHARAHHELQILQSRALDRWRSGCLRGEEPKSLSAKIIDGLQREKRRIGEFIITSRTLPRGVDVASPTEDQALP
jgi:hypothetical protein